MGARYLTELAHWLTDAGLIVVEYHGWQSRARSSGGFDGDRPWCVMWHHTASMTDPDGDAGYIATGSPDAPLANLMIDRAGVVWLIAAGATNTNGKGYPLTFSRGTVPADSMNTHAVGIEICNNGVGEPYPRAQLDAAFAVSLAVCAGLGLEPTDAACHHDYAPDRKVDAATAAAAAAAGWAPAAVNSSGSWALTDLRAELTRRAGGGSSPGPPPPLEEDDMTLTVVTDPDGSGRVWIGDGMTRRVVPSMNVFNNYVLGANNARYRLVNANGDVVRDIADVSQVGADTLESLGAG